MKWIVFAAAAVLAQPAQAEFLKKESPYPVVETIDRFEAAAKERNLTIFARIDHAAGAVQVGQDLRPTLLLIFGSPAVGAPLMQVDQTIGLSLPLKVLAWQDAAGKVWLGYDTPASIAALRNVPRDHPLIGSVTEALNAMTEAAIKR